jgi:hypothetical protein
MFRQVLASESPKPKVTSITPFSLSSATDNGSEGDDKFSNGDSSDGGGGGDGSSFFSSSHHETEKKNLFKQSEHDRIRLIAENRRLRDEISENGVQSSLGQFTIGDDSELVGDADLHTIVNDLNAWDCERDELDAQIDRLTDQKESLVEKLQQQGYKVRHELGEDGKDGEVISYRSSREGPKGSGSGEWSGSSPVRI